MKSKQLLNNREINPILFQFHYGTIKSCISVFQCFPLKEHFNSTMVRLKEERTFRTGCRSLFQFHYGTIKR